MKTISSMIGPKVVEQLASTTFENVGKQPSSIYNCIRHEALDSCNHMHIKNNLTIVLCPGEDSAEIKSLPTPQSY
jgi:hypothetical protein